MNRIAHTARHIVSLVASLLLIPSLAAVAQNRAEARRAESAKFVGAEVCQACHEDHYKTFVQSAHAQTLKREKRSEQGCEACHGPGSAHAEAGDPDRIRRFAAARQETTQSVCAACHDPRLSEAHANAHLSCLTCHSAHHYQKQKALLVADESQLCRKCHQPSVPGPFHL